MTTDPTAPANPTPDPGLRSRAPETCATCGAAVGDLLQAPIAAFREGAVRPYCSRRCYDDAPGSRSLRGVPPAGRPPSSRPAAPVSVGPVSAVEMVARLAIPRGWLLPGALGDGDGDDADGRARRRGALDAEGPPWLRRIRARAPVVLPLLAGLVSLAAFAGLRYAARPVLVLVLAALPLGLLFALSADTVRRLSRDLGHATALATQAGALAAMVVRAASMPTSSLRLARLAETAWLLVGAVLAYWAVWRAERRLHAARQSRLPVPEQPLRVEREDGMTAIRRSDEIRAGENVVVRAGEIVPVDGVLVSGSLRLSAEAPGRAERVVGTEGPVLAGARVLDGAATVLATRAGNDTSVARTQSWVRAPAPRGSWLRMLDSVVDWVAPGALALAVVPPLVGVAPVSWVDLVLRVCALLPIGAAARWVRLPYAWAAWTAAYRGVVLRDLLTLERAAGVGTVVLAVRGTATVGAPEVVEVVALGAADAEQVVSLAAGAELAMVPHPVAQAITAFANRHGLEPEAVRRPLPLPAGGVAALDIEGRPIVVGSREAALAEGVSVALADDRARGFEEDACTAVFVARGGKLLGVIGLWDPLRAEARSSVQQLIDDDRHVILLGGDTRATLEALGRQIDVSDVRAQVPADERGVEVSAIAELGTDVAMVGRPGADAAALAAARVAFAVGTLDAPATGASVAMVGEDLRDVADTLVACRAVRLRSRLGISVVLATAAGAAVMLQTLDETLWAAVLAAFVPTLAMVLLARLAPPATPVHEDLAM